MFRCQLCKTELSSHLEELADLTALSDADNAPHVPEGRYVLSDGSFFTGTEGKVIMNLHDARNIRRTDDPSRLNGCCGLDGLDGPNVLCRKGHAVGTEKSDCWMPHALILEPDAISTEIAS